MGNWVKNIESVSLPGSKGTQLHLNMVETLDGWEEATLVSVPARGEIPLHKHDVEALMLITGGKGTVLSEDDVNGTSVKAGSVVFFEKQQNHGFKADAEGLTFLSLNGGIAGVPGEFDLTYA